MKPPPDLIEGKEEYKMEAITSHKNWGQGYRYLVKWKGYPISDNTWEPASGFKNAQEILTEYQLTHYLSPLNLILYHVLLVLQLQNHLFSLCQICCRPQTVTNPSQANSRMQRPPTDHH